MDNIYITVEGLKKILPAFSEKQIFSIMMEASIDEKKNEALLNTIKNSNKYQHNLTANSF